MTRRRFGRPEPRDRDKEPEPHADPESVARTILLTKLTATARSRHELAEALAARNVPDDVATRVLDRFEQVGLVDDEAFAESWVRSRQAAKGLSRRALGRELLDKGVDADTITASLAGVDDEAEAAAARRLVEHKLRSIRQLDEATRTRRLVAMLARKGYSADVSFAVVRAALQDDNSLA